MSTARARKFNSEVAAVEMSEHNVKSTIAAKKREILAGIPPLLQHRRRKNLLEGKVEDVNNELAGSADLGGDEAAAASFFYLKSKGITVQPGDDMAAHLAVARRMMARDGVIRELEVKKKQQKAKRIVPRKGDDMLEQVNSANCMRETGLDAKAKNGCLPDEHLPSVDLLSVKEARSPQFNDGIARREPVSVAEATAAFQYLQGKGVVVRQGDDMLEHVNSANRMRAAEEQARLRTEKN
jgi:hypothetical protein